MGASGSSCPSSLPTVEAPNETHVTFLPPVLNPDTSAGADKAIYHQKVCGVNGLLKKTGSKGADNQFDVCFSPHDMNCFKTSGCECLINEGNANVGRVKTPEGVSMKVYNSWNCSGKLQQTYSSFAENTYPVTDKKQSYYFTLLPSFECDESGNVVSSNAKKSSKKSASGASSEVSNGSAKGENKWLMIGIGVIVILILGLLASKPKKAVKDMSVDQIISSVGLQPGVVASKGAPKGSINAILANTDTTGAGF